MTLIPIALHRAMNGIVPNLILQLYNNFIYVPVKDTGQEVYLDPPNPEDAPFLLKRFRPLPEDGLLPLVQGILHADLSLQDADLLIIDVDPSHVLVKDHLLLYGVGYVLLCDAGHVLQYDAGHDPLCVADLVHLYYADHDHRSDGHQSAIGHPSDVDPDLPSGLDHPLPVDEDHRLP